MDEYLRLSIVLHEGYKQMKRLSDSDLDLFYYLLLNNCQKLIELNINHRTYIDYCIVEGGAMEAITGMFLSGVLFPSIVDKYDRDSLLRLYEFITNRLYVDAHHSIGIKPYEFDNTLDSIRDKTSSIIKENGKTIPYSLATYYLSLILSDLNILANSTAYENDVESMYNESAMMLIAFIKSLRQGWESFKKNQKKSYELSDSGKYNLVQLCLDVFGKHTFSKEELNDHFYSKLAAQSDGLFYTQEGRLDRDFLYSEQISDWLMEEKVDWLKVYNFQDKCVGDITRILNISRPIIQSVACIYDELDSLGLHHYIISDDHMDEVPNNVIYSEGFYDNDKNIIFISRRYPQYDDDQNFVGFNQVNIGDAIFILAHELRHVWQKDYYEEKYYNTSTNDEMDDISEIDADGFALAYIFSDRTPFTSDDLTSDVMRKQLLYIVFGKGKRLIRAYEIAKEYMFGGRNKLHDMAALISYNAKINGFIQ